MENVTYFVKLAHIVLGICQGMLYFKDATYGRASMTIKMRCLTLLLTLVFGIWPAANADTLRVGDMPPSSIQVPSRGMTMDQVESRFGAPNSKVAAVGDPPISRWVYPKYTVYFEYQLVLHSVTHRQ
jgi:hypothetical protein